MSNKDGGSTVETGFTIPGAGTRTVDIDTSPEALAALRESMDCLEIEIETTSGMKALWQARDVIAALEKERDAALYQIKKLRLGYSAAEFKRFDAALAEVKP